MTFLGTPNAALWSTLFLIVWRYAGFYMLLMLVGPAGIPTDLFEAARVDGASAWQTFRRITIPLLRPSLALATVLCVTGSLLAFDQFYILTKGGPDNSTITIVGSSTTSPSRARTTSAWPRRSRCWSWAH